MKALKYELYQSTLSSGEVVTCPVVMQWSESAEETAKAESYNGKYTIEHDWKPELGAITTE